MTFHQAEVNRTVTNLAESYPPPAVISTEPRIYAPDGCLYCLPDIMVIGGTTVKFIEVKTGSASLTGNQATIYPTISDGTAVISPGLAQQLRVPPGTTIAEAFPGGYSIIEVYAPGYTD